MHLSFTKSAKCALGLTAGLAIAATGLAQNVSNVADAGAGLTDNVERSFDLGPIGTSPTDILWPQGACPCEGGDANEAEACGDDSNGGCNSDPNSFESIAVNTTVCGTAWADGGTRDTDWWQFTLAEEQLVTITVVSEFPSALFTLNGICDAPAADVIGDPIGAVCTENVIQTTLPAGTHTFFVGPGDGAGGIFEGFPCGTSNGYTVTLSAVTDEGSCCQANGVCQVTSTDECAGLNGIFTLGESCSPNPCDNQGAPPNDQCFLAETLVVDGPSVDGFTNFAQTGDSLPGCFGVDGANGVWYTFDGNGNEITVSTSGSDFGAQIAVYTNGDSLFCSDVFCCVASSGQETGGSDCCTEGGNGTPGCDDPECEALICGQDSFCCDTSWDGICADAAQEQCEVCTGGPAGDAEATFCSVNGQTYKVFVTGGAGSFAISATSGDACDDSGGSCVVCPVEGIDEGEDCGSDNNGGCNSVTQDEFTIVNLGDVVCGTAWADGGTRDTDWFQITLAETTTLTVTLDHDLLTGSAFFLVTGVCAAPAVGADGSTAACVQGVIETTLAPGTHTFFVGQTAFEGAPCPPPGDPCGGVGVNYVISFGAEEFVPCDLTCNGTEEADACEQGGGGTPSDSDCCIDNGTPGCDDPECEALICGQDSFCCDTSWDQICADAAIAQCEVCEGEGGTVDPNGGCNSTPPSFGSISDGETICGQAPASGGTRDTDWYNFSIAQARDIEITISSQFDAAVFLLDANDCAAIVLIDQVFNAAAGEGACNTSTLTIEGLAAGDYSLFVGAGEEAGGIFEGVFCDQNAGYSLTLEINPGPGGDTGACCLSACECGQATAEDCALQGGTFQGVDTLCDGDACDSCSGDLDLDNDVDSTDLNILLAAFGATNGGDLDCDGDTDSTDLNILLAGFGDDCP